jgi:hypothetical protein
MQSFIFDLSQIPTTSGAMDAPLLDAEASLPNNLVSLCRYRNLLGVKHRFESGFRAWIQRVTRQQVQVLLDAEFQSLSEDEKDWIVQQLIDASDFD